MRFYQKWLVGLEGLFRRRSLEDRYGAEMAAIYDSFADVLPPIVTSVLDIGSGMAGINVFTYRQHGCPEIYLLDKQGTSDTINSGFHARAEQFSYYNSFSDAIALLAMNGVDPARVRTIDVDVEPLPAAAEFDVIYSFLSWGFHYPVPTYLDAAYRALRIGGFLVMDIRKGTGGELELERRFGGIRLLADAPKYVRVAARKL